MQSDSVEEKSVRHNKVGEENITKSISSDYAASTESQDLSEYTYEAAIENYKSRVMRVSSSSSHIEGSSKEMIPARLANRNCSQGSKIEDRLLSMEMKLNSNDTYDKEPMVKNDLPKVNIAKRRELFEQAEKIKSDSSEKPSKSPSTKMPEIKSIKQRMSNFKSEETESKEERQSSFNIDVNISSVKGRFLILEKNVNSEPVEKPNKIDVPLSVSLKDRLSSLQSCVDSSNNAKVNSNSNKEKATILNNGSCPSRTNSNYDEIMHKRNEAPTLQDNIESIDNDREDSGIHTTDVSCSVSQADEQNEERFDELNLVNIEANNRIEETAERNVIEVQVERSNTKQLEERLEVYNTTTVEKCDDLTHQTTQNLSMPDLIQHNNISLASEDTQRTTDEHQDENVSLSLSESAAESVICDGTLLLDVKNLIENLASTTVSDKVEESSIYSNDFEDTTTFNNSSMFDETTANDDDSSIISSFTSPYRQLLETGTTIQDYNYCSTLTAPSLSLNLSSIKANIELSPCSPDQTPNNELVLDYFSKSPAKKSDTSSPRSPSRSILNFIKTNLLHSSNEQTMPQESSKFYVPLNESAKQNNEANSKSPPILEKKDSTESNTTMTCEINSALEEEMLKL